MEDTKTRLGEITNKYQKGSIIVIEHHSENYSDSNEDAILAMQQLGFMGVFLSFQRPYSNLKDHFEKKGIDPERMIVLDAASDLAGIVPCEEKGCVFLCKSLEVDDIVRSIYLSLDKLKCEKRFIIIDSLSTFSIHKPISEVLRFSEFLIRSSKKNQAKNVTLLFCTATEQAKKNFIRDIALHADEVILKNG